MSNDMLRKIAFSQIKGLQLSDAKELLSRVGGIDCFFELPAGDLWEKIGAQKSFCSDASRRALLELGARELEFTSKNRIFPLFMTDEDFPNRLEECVDAPPILFRLGNCNLNATHVVSIVGTRRATNYGLRYTSDLVSAIAESLDDVVIVSGLAYGIDVAAHKAALAVGIPTVGVVAHGLNTIYPADHRDIAARMVKNGGAIVTEYSSGAPVHRGNFLARNRIVAGLADVTIIVESEEKGGAMVTASIAGAYNRDVCAAPGRIFDRYSAGPLKLIFSNKAALIRGVDDLIEIMNWKAKPKPNIQSRFDFTENSTLDDVQMKIVDYLRANEKSTVNEMVSALGIPYSTLSAKMMEMEMDDIVTSLPGACFSLNI